MKDFLNDAKDDLAIWFRDLKDILIEGREQLTYVALLVAGYVVLCFIPAP